MASIQSAFNGSAGAIAGIGTAGVPELLLSDKAYAEVISGKRDVAIVPGWLTAPLGNLVLRPAASDSDNQLTVQLVAITLAFVHSVSLSELRRDGYRDTMDLILAMRAQLDCFDIDSPITVLRWTRIKR